MKVDASVIYKVPKTPVDGALVIIALEENSFIKKQIGNWLPLEVIHLPKDKDLFFRLDSINRKDNNVTIKYSFYCDEKRLFQREFQWNDDGADGDVPAFFSSTEKGYSFNVKQNSDNTYRKFIVKKYERLDSLIKEIDVSKAALSFKWKESNFVRP